MIWHLEQAGYQGEIHQMLQSEAAGGGNAWYETCERLNLRSVFTGDIARAWQLAKNIYAEAPEHSIGLQVRYALTSSFLREANKRASFDRLQEDWAFTNVLLNASRYLPDLAAKIIKSTHYPSSLNAASKEQTLYILLKNLHLESPEMALELTDHLLPNPSSISALSKLLPQRPIFSLPLLNLVTHTSQSHSLLEGLTALVKQQEHKLHPELFNLLAKLKHPLDQIILLDQFEQRLPDILKAKAKVFRHQAFANLSVCKMVEAIFPWKRVQS
ncbi:MAG: hypothetical protein HC810_03320 [Acaryochloridaceae cyanobacterium RL_2_7]|nr:hypothetical protein [Acaryochloridaceae cyanobacterium RL_2_7]